MLFQKQHATKFEAGNLQFWGKLGAKWKLRADRCSSEVGILQLSVGPNCNFVSPSTLSTTSLLIISKK